MVPIGAIGGVPSPTRDFTDYPEVSKEFHDLPDVVPDLAVATGT